MKKKEKPEFSAPLKTIFHSQKTVINYYALLVSIWINLIIPLGFHGLNILTSATWDLDKTLLKIHGNYIKHIA